MLKLLCTAGTSSPEASNAFRFRNEMVFTEGGSYLKLFSEIQDEATKGYIIRCLVKGFNNSALTRQVSNAMISAGLILSPDIGKYIDYLEDAGYIELQYHGKLAASQVESINFHEARSAQRFFDAVGDRCSKLGIGIMVDGETFKPKK